MVRETVYTLPFRWSKAVWAITLLYYIGAVVLIGMLIHLLFSGAIFAGIVALIIATPIVVGIVVYCEGYSPQRLEISASQITILRRYNSITIPRSVIVSIRSLRQKDMSWTINIGGCSGLYGYFGSFKNRQLGEFTLYTTAMDNLYLITLSNGQKIVIGCDEPKLLQ